MNDDTARTIAAALLDIDAVKLSTKTPRTFKSGILSPVYVDNRTVPFHPTQWAQVVNGFRTLIETLPLPHDVIAGIAAAGIPHSAALAYATSRPSVFVRKEAKGYGMGNRVEGGDVTGRRVLLVEDLVTTGGSSLSGVKALREAGADVSHILAIVSYGFPESHRAFDEAGITLHTLTDFPTILRDARERGLFGAEAVALVDDWLHDPHGWGKRHGHA